VRTLSILRPWFGGGAGRIEKKGEKVPRGALGPMETIAGDIEKKVSQS